MAVATVVSGPGNLGGHLVVRPDTRQGSLGSDRLDDAVTDEKMVLTSSSLTPEGVIKLSMGKKKHILLKPA